MKRITISILIGVFIIGIMASCDYSRPISSSENDSVGFSTGQSIPSFANEMIAIETTEYSNSKFVNGVNLVDPNDGRIICLTCQISGEIWWDYTGYYARPVWSPDHSKIAFVMFRREGGFLDLYVSDSEGNVKLLRTWITTLLPSPIFWSPDSQKVGIAVDVDDDRGFILSIIDTLSAEEINLTNFEWGAPIWLGNQIVSLGAYRHSIIYSQGLNDSEPRQLSQIPFRQDEAAGPSWSPLGEKLLLYGIPLGNAGENGNDAADEANNGMYVLNRAGDIIYKYTIGSEVPFDGSFSPDGQKIVFSIRPTDSNLLYANILIVDLRTGTLTQLTDSTEYWGENPTWSPQGDKIAYIGLEGSLMIMNVEGINAEVLFAETPTLFVQKIIWR